MQLLSTGSDGCLKLWTVKTNSCAATYDAHEDKAWALAIRPDGGAIASGGADSLLTIWDDVTEVPSSQPPINSTTARSATHPGRSIHPHSTNKQQKTQGKGQKA